MNKRTETTSTASETENLDKLFRALALDDPGTIEGLSMEEFEEITELVLTSGDEEARTPLGITIRAACLLLLALVESGGLCMRHPEREIERLRIDVAGANLGYLRWPERRRKKKKGGKFLNRREQIVLGPRQFLYQLGRIHLLTFIYLRLHTREKNLRAVDGDLLLPTLPKSKAELLGRLAGDLSWIKEIRGAVTWGKIFNHWLQRMLIRVRQRLASANPQAKASWSSVVDRALWRLLDRDRYPILIAARRGRFLPTPIPDKQYQELLGYGIGRTTDEETKTHELDEITDINDLHALRSVDDEDLAENAELAILDLEVLDSEGSTSVADNDFLLVNAFLRKVKDVNKEDEGRCRREFIREARSLSDSDQLECKRDSEIRYLLKWAAKLLGNKKRFSTVYTYCHHVMRLLRALSPMPFLQCGTDDLAVLLESYSSPNTVRNHRRTFRRFDEFLTKRCKLTRSNEIKWSSQSLYADEQYREYTLITEYEYQLLRQATGETEDPLLFRVLLTLLRRCGLRIDEAASLNTWDFLGIT